MGGLSHLFYFNQAMARKVLAHKPPGVDGLEAPRNSLELQMQASQSTCAAIDDLYSYGAEEARPDNNCYPIEASIKRLINEEISRGSASRKNAPSIVARLMGVDMLPLETFDKNKESRVTKNSKKDKTSKFSGQRQLDSVYQSEEIDTDGWGSSNIKLRPREHPQEEELQKFKKEFEAWQAARFKECSKVVQLDSNPARLLVQEKTNKQKSLLNSDSVKFTEHEGVVLKTRSHEKAGSQHHRHKSEPLLSDHKDHVSSRYKTVNRSSEYPSLINSDQKLDTSSAPTRIVILKPGPDNFCVHEESWTTSSGTLADRTSIEDFLEEVKERLKCDVQGKTLKRSCAVRGSGIETPFSEKPSDPKQIARHIAKQVRESVTRDFGVNLIRSESTRSYRSEIQFNGPGSPEFINRDTRRFLSERLRNVLKREIHLDAPVVVTGSSRSSDLDNEKFSRRQVGDNLKAGTEGSYWEILKDEQEMQTRSFRHGGDDGVLQGELSSRNLVRSLSAPVSGTSFGKLLLEDRNILTGAHIRRKHEALENVTLELKKRKKERFNIKEKVSNFRYNFTLRGKLFRKRIQSMVEPHSSEHDFVKDIMSGPTVVMNFGKRHIMENSTEVPPSPASVCSSAQEESWRQSDILTPASTPDVILGEENGIPQVFKEISFNLNELRRQLEQLGSNTPAYSTIEQEHMEAIMDDIEDKAEMYIRDLLVASGFYYGSSDKYLSRWDPLAKPISNSVFEEVEASCKKTVTDDNDKKVEDHKMLFDLLNEALSNVLAPPPRSMSRFRRKIIGSSMAVPPLIGRRLLGCVWEMIRENLYLPNDKMHYSLDVMVARYLESSPWSGLIDEEVNSFGKEMESVIIGEVIEEIVKDMHL